LKAEIENKSVNSKNTNNTSSNSILTATRNVTPLQNRKDTSLHGTNNSLFACFEERFVTPSSKHQTDPIR